MAARFRMSAARTLLLLLAVLLGGCPLSDSKSPQERAEEEFREAERTPQGRIAGDFARRLVAGDFEAASAMLTPALRATLTPENLSAEYARMIEYGGGPANAAQPVTTMDDWPDKQPDDLGWAYVSISGLGFDEAVSVVVTQAGQIRQVEWGRP